MKNNYFIYTTNDGLNGTHINGFIDKSGKFICGPYLMSGSDSGYNVFLEPLSCEHDQDMAVWCDSVEEIDEAHGKYKLVIGRFTNDMGEEVVSIAKDVCGTINYYDVGSREFLSPNEEPLYIGGNCEHEYFQIEEYSHVYECKKRDNDEVCSVVEETIITDVRTICYDTTVVSFASLSNNKYLIFYGYENSMGGTSAVVFLIDDDIFRLMTDISSIDFNDIYGINVEHSTGDHAVKITVKDDTDDPIVEETIKFGKIYYAYYT